ncbi:hypothetical protein CBL_11287 [Carabus blaptoides fortunei]
MGSKNKLLVFDLDYTLWPFFVDTHVDPPFRKNDKGDIVDTSGRKVKYYPEVPKMLETLHSEGYTLAVASRTSEIKGANQLLQLFDWDKYFSYKEIYPGCKVTHFNNFRKDSKMEYKNMIFFDDERRNIVDISKLGVTSILVNNGMTMTVAKEGLEQHTKQDH